MAKNRKIKNVNPPRMRRPCPKSFADFSPLGFSPFDIFFNQIKYAVASKKSNTEIIKGSHTNLKFAISV